MSEISSGIRKLFITPECDRMRTRKSRGLTEEMIDKGKKNLTAEFFKNSPKKMQGNEANSSAEISNPVFANVIRSKRMSVSEDEGMGSEPNTPELRDRARKFASPAKVCSKNLIAMFSSPEGIKGRNPQPAKDPRTPEKEETPQTFDILAKLEDQNLLHIRDKIFGALEAPDIHNCSQVSKSWQTFITRRHKKTLTAYARAMRIKKKNLNRNRSPNWKTASLLKSRDSFANRAPKMSPVKSLNTHSPITAAVLRGPVTRKTEHWARVKASLVNGEQIYAYCPFCKNYAKKTTTGRGICIHSSCSRVFCCLCRGTHGEGMCPNPKPITRKLFSPDKTKRSVRRL
ncbi:Oidioi.mRNA.OKI2018_I69.chr2.g5086.t1.cds [Oikopleura dioica]|uniref:Oidioi.mRNA.OKI2018_I69.chr2.g5086.t1.cds n=1 Tax=Oikopleura dioica TaxID=34765 RepID=A0ABN7SZG1_OIKDI|nr:Oidioi.mRNA.OKI2018_I69.chr2.g5086.t1.cds [Oikopleura dioica]